MSDAITRGDAASRYERTIDAQPDMAWALMSRAIKFSRRSVRPGLEEFSGRPEGVPHWRVSDDLRPREHTPVVAVERAPTDFDVQIGKFWRGDSIRPIAADYFCACTGPTD
jgi:hypothetical protein